jgi:hypothetical protein
MAATVTPTASKRTCCCHSVNAADCMESRCGKSFDIDGRREECECVCHDEPNDDGEEEES